MHRIIICTSGVLALTLSVALSGCANQAAEPKTGKDSSTKVSDASSNTDDAHAEHDHAGHGHDHPSEGPHHGSLIELGKEEYHAELVHDEAGGTVTIYILDGGAKNTVPIQSRELVINLKHDGRGEQFKLAASPDKGDPAGKSSRFVSNDAELSEDLDAEGAEARLVVKIAGKSYTGDMKHDHDGHDHGDHDHDNHDHK